MAKHYVNNKTLNEEMKKYYEMLRLCEVENKPKPQISNYVGECVLLICNRLAYKPNFINYTYRDDMIADGIENCIMAVDNFNPAKSSNPFAYFTQIAYNAFLRRIAKEKKQTYIKHKNFENLFSVDEMNSVFNDGHHMTQVVNEYSHDIIATFEEKIAQNKEKKPVEPVGMEKFFKE
jgi:DNA-directed RNA polymerase specialized sigma subunit